MPVAALLRVCAVAPYVPYIAGAPTQRLRSFETVEWWWVCPYQRDRAGPARGLHWQIGVAPHARRRPEPRLEEQCEWCSGLGNTDANPMFTCDNKPERCLRGWHKQCLLERRMSVPRAKEVFYCSEHSPS